MALLPAVGPARPRGGVCGPGSPPRPRAEAPGGRSRSWRPQPTRDRSRTAGRSDHPGSPGSTRRASSAARPASKPQGMRTRTSGPASKTSSHARRRSALPARRRVPRRPRAGPSRGPSGRRRRAGRATLCNRRADGVGPTTASSTRANRSSRAAIFARASPPRPRASPTLMVSSRTSCERGGVQREDLRLALQRRSRPLDEVRGDGADVAEALGHDEVGGQTLEQLRVQGVDAARRRSAASRWRRLSPRSS